MVAVAQVVKQIVAQQVNADELLADDMGRFWDDALGFVMYAYDWDSDPALRVCKLQAPWCFIYPSEYGPDVWACELLDRISAQVRTNNFDGTHAVKAIREAIASGHGIGKSALVAWLVDWIMSTRPHARGVVTANTMPQLETKTWAEIAKWTKRCITGHWFHVSTGKGAMKMVHKDFPESWRCDAQTCKEENSEAFAGLHAVTSTPFYIYDEASAVPDAIWEVSEGGMTDGEPMWFAFGNPTRNSGKFHQCFHGQRHRWGTQQIDSRTVQITNKGTIQEWIDDYGEDSDFAKIRVRGMFPSMSSKQFISVTDADGAFGRHLRAEQYNWAPKILVVDPAWEGDDEFVIGIRQGLRFEILRTIPKNDNDVVMATLIAQLEDEHKADAVFVDAGYGTGIVSVGRTWGREWQLVWFASESTDPGCLNKRAQMYKDARDWMKAGGSIPEDTRLYNEMISVETVPRMDGKIQIESKKDLKRRGLPSPGRMDALVISFAYPVQAKIHKPPPNANAGNPRGHNPYAPGVLKTNGTGHDPYARK